MTIKDIENAFLKTKPNSDWAIEDQFVYNLYGQFPKGVNGLNSPPKEVCKSAPLFSKEGWYGMHWEIDNVDLSKTVKNFYLNYPDLIHFSPTIDNDFLITDDFIIEISSRPMLYVKDVLPDDFFSYYVMRIEKPTIKFLTGMTSNGIETISKEIKYVELNSILDNYNEDLPYKELLEFLKSEDNGLCVLRGLPGTGKSYFLRAIINEMRDKSFMAVDTNDFATVCGNKQYFNTFENKILIIEDCEELLRDRNGTSFSGLVSNLLNMSDGLMGDSVNLKIICTFNTDLKNIDKALLRKGRIKLFYEFKELTKDRADALRKKLGKVDSGSNVLCDIFNEDSVGVNDSKITSKIGF